LIREALWGVLKVKGDAACAALRHLLKSAGDVAFHSGIEHKDLQSKRAGCRLQLARYNFGAWVTGVGRVDQERHGGRRRDHLAQQLQLLWQQFDCQLGNTGDISAAGQGLRQAPPQLDGPQFERRLIRLVAVFAANASGIPPVAAITPTWRRTKSAARAGNFSY
jgi:hypothetical protein